MYTSNDLTLSMFSRRELRAIKLSELQSGIYWEIQMQVPDAYIRIFIR